MGLKIIIAAYPGRCGLCGDDITENVDEIVSVDGEWCHVDCARDEGEDVD